MSPSHVAVAAFADAKSGPVRCAPVGGERLGSVNGTGFPVSFLDPCWSPHRTHEHGRAATTVMQEVFRPSRPHLVNNFTSQR